ncbi:tautomerase family protein [Tumebacillus flagellatus]|uniref:4-oxalocrotonate tautomerase-like domain-containing protein n=1 Tax=Tumebacillus flagellatus TaxID=1157490 RepID=A0A074LT72_9BACL|nr:tautomerase family protein [Tumebacillus flagellatus]KEO83700.1 hypothetical protein EL26_08595 [Tumebacillus flagellatus]
MPFTRVSILKGKSSEYKKALLSNVYLAMRETFNVPEDDLVMVIHEHEPDGFLYSGNYLNIDHAENVFINLVESPKENGSFGNGVAQYAE